MNRWAMGVFLVICVAVTAYFLLKPPPVDECSFMSHQQSAGVDFTATVKKVELAKGSLNLTSNDVRDLDLLAKDYAIKFETSCRDHKSKAISDDEYACRRRNMDSALDRIRVLNLTLDKSSTGAVDRTAVLTALEQLRSASASDFSSGCGPSLAVAPSSLVFGAGVPERSVRITNPGNRPLVFSIEKLPESFIPTPTTGHVSPGDVVMVSIVRTLIQPTARTIEFVVKDNFDHEFTVSLDVTLENASLYSDLANISKVPANASSDVAMQKALDVTNQVTPNLPQSSAARYLIAANILNAKGSATQGTLALQHAVQQDASLKPKLEYLAIVAPHQYKLKPGGADLAHENFKNVK